jgi:hypothetical protein
MVAQVSCARIEIAVGVGSRSETPIVLWAQEAPLT